LVNWEANLKTQELALEPT